MLGYSASDFIFNMQEFESRMWSLGDGRQHELSLLSRSIGGDYEKNNEFKISLGDILLACGSEIALIALTINSNKRAHIATILPRIRSFVNITQEKRILDAVSFLRNWVDGHEPADFNDHYSACSEVVSEINSGLLSADEIEGGFTYHWGEKVHTALFAEILMDTLGYARKSQLRAAGLFQDSAEEGRFFPVTLFELIMKNEKDPFSDIEALNSIAFTAHVLALSPPLALVGRQ